MAVSYVNRELGIPAVAGPFPGTALPDEWGVELFDAVSLWYVIEHFPDLRTVLAELNRLLKKGGVLAFSTPSGSGISFRKNRKFFYNRSPVDHFTIWNPRSSSRILNLFGFKVKKIVVTGHHPERFFSENRHPSPILIKTAGLLSRLFRLGDTFEIYAEKIGETE